VSRSSRSRSVERQPAASAIPSMRPASSTSTVIGSFAMPRELLRCCLVGSRQCSSESSSPATLGRAVGAMTRPGSPTCQSRQPRTWNVPVPLERHGCQVPAELDVRPSHRSADVPSQTQDRVAYSSPSGCIRAGELGSGITPDERLSLHTAEATGSKPVTPTSTNSLQGPRGGACCQQIASKPPTVVAVALRALCRFGDLQISVPAEERSTPAQCHMEFEPKGGTSPLAQVASRRCADL
jgi:hypothetical protein